MITDQIIFIVNSWIQLVIGFFPEADPDIIDAIGTNFQGFKDLVDGVSYFFPVSELMLVFSMVVLIEYHYVIYRGFMWVIKRLPFIG